MRIWEFLGQIQVGDVFSSLLRLLLDLTIVFLWKLNKICPDSSLPPPTPNKEEGEEDAADFCADGWDSGSMPSMGLLGWTFTKKYQVRGAHLRLSVGRCHHVLVPSQAGSLQPTHYPGLETCLSGGGKV